MISGGQRMQRVSKKYGKNGGNADLKSTGLCLLIYNISLNYTEENNLVGLQRS